MGQTGEQQNPPRRFATPLPGGESAAAWDSYLNGIQGLRQQNYEAALQNWIDAITIDRDIDDDGPRRACIALFTWLGPEHELTKKYHRAFTSALF